MTDFNQIGELALLSQDDDESRKTRPGDKSRATAERFEEHVKDLVEKLTKELGPVGEELRKILENSIDEIHETLKKEGVTADDLRKALEKSHDEMRKAFEKGGTINKELRESVEKSRRDLQEEWERARGDLRSAMRDRLESTRQQERGREARRPPIGAKDLPTKSCEKEQDRAELEKARGEVRALEQQLRQANRRLLELQRRRCSAVAPAAGDRRFLLPKAAPDRAPEDQPAPRQRQPQSRRASRSPPRRSAESSRRVTPPAGRQPSSGRPPSEGAPRVLAVSLGDEQRLRDLDEQARATSSKSSRN